MTLEELFKKHQNEIKDFHAAKEKSLSKLEKDHKAILTGVGGIKNVPPSTKERMEKEVQNFDKEWNLDKGLRFAEMQERHERERQAITQGFVDRKSPDKSVNQQQEQSHSHSSNWRSSNAKNFQQNQNSFNQGNNRQYEKSFDDFDREQGYQRHNYNNHKQPEKVSTQDANEEKSIDQSQKREPEWEALRNEHKKLRERGLSVSKILSVDDKPTEAKEPIENNEPTKTNEPIENNEPTKNIQADDYEATKQAFREEHQEILERKRNRVRGR